MMKIVRLPAPYFLTGKYKKWGKRFKERREANPNALFSWTQLNGRRINKILLDDLMTMTEKHCSFCDGFPIETVSSKTIEHFRPKSQFPHLAYVWINLFYCCSKCQESKQEDFDKKLLKPDVDNYSFDYYFQYDTKTGEIIPNPDRENDEIERAKITIKLYGWNNHNRPTARKRTIRMYNDSNNSVLNDFPYRFILNYLS
ncbi:MAG: retron system putative HNH endonuclease [Actinomycetota bacterium]